GVRSVAVYSDLHLVPDDIHDHFDLVQVYGIPAHTERVIVAFRRRPLPPLPDGVPVLLDRPIGVAPALDDLRRHWQAAAVARARGRPGAAPPSTPSSTGSPATTSAGPRRCIWRSG